VTGRARPDFLSSHHASAFADADVVRAYRYRAPYPEETFSILRDLIVEPRVALDVGCGSGALTRPIARFVERVDAVDPSAEMLAEGRRLARAEANIRWMLGRVEDVDLDGPYGLITAGASLHWLDWEVALPRLARVAAPGARLAIALPQSKGPWWDELVSIIRQFSLFTDYREIEVVEELATRGLFDLEGRRHTAPVQFQQPVEEFIAGLFSHSSLARSRLGPERSAAFAAAVREMLQRISGSATVPLVITAEVIWGRPLEGQHS
jgi:SAM-dependent methyltransferase